VGLALLATALLALLLSHAPAGAADDDPGLTVSIGALSPAVLRDGADVTMTGTVTNNGSRPWTNVQAYLVIPASPFTTRGQIDEAIDNGNAYTGTRVTDLASIAIMGDLQPGQSAAFRIKVPYGSLGISGAEGVYPVGVQILGTDDEGERSADAIARATTFLPLVAADREPVATSVVWPFLMPDHRRADGTYADSASLLADVSAGGRLRNYLDLASSLPLRSTTVVIDPALLVGVDDLATGRHVRDEVDLDDAQRAEVEDFLQDLLALARRQSCWVLGYDRPDVLALAENADIAEPLREAIDAATDSALTQFQLSGRRVSWPSRDGVTAGLLRSLRGDGDSPVIVSSSALPQWDRRDGSLVQLETPSGPLPLLVNDTLDAEVPGRLSVVALRQRILSVAALATLQRAIDPKSRADAVTVVDPAWDPGTGWAQAKLPEAFAAGFTAPASLDDLLTRSIGTYDGTVVKSAKAVPLSRGQLQAAAEVVKRGAVLSSIIPESDAVDVARDREVAGLLGIRWRQDPRAGLALARSRAAEADAELERISVEGPPSVTLSSSEGAFPLTITNGTDKPIRVGLSLASSNPALSIPDVDPVDIAADERRTITVNVDLGRQKTTTLTARLSSAEGETLGEPAVFNVRSSRVGVVLWVAMGLAGLLVLAALLRRFRRRRTAMTSDPLDPTGLDDDD
jgi:hypothetical protein